MSDSGETYLTKGFSCPSNAPRGPRECSALVPSSKQPRAALTLTNTTCLPKVPTKTIPVRDTAPISFPFNGFTYFLTLFSKSFSPFPHGTFSLSVSCQYLALDEVYHPLKAALSSNPTRRKGITTGWDRRTKIRGSHPLWRPVPRHLGHRPPGHSFYRLQSGTRRAQVLSLSCSLFTRRY